MCNKICYVIGAGEFYYPLFSLKERDYVIAVDGGYQYLKNMGMQADMVIGDFDSLPERPDHQNVIALKKEKDDTDMLGALKKGLEKDYRVFYIYGGMGGRVDHTMANLQCLAFLSNRQARGYLIGKTNAITAITDTHIDFEQTCSGIVSMFSHSDISTGVIIRGLKYELNNATIKNDFPIGISNEFIGQKSSISVNKGTLLITYPKDSALC